MLQRGNVAEWIPIFEAVRHRKPGTPVTRRNSGATLISSRAASKTRVARIEPLVATDFDLPLDFSWFLGMATSCYTVIELGDVKSARLLLERLTPFAHLLPWAGVTSSYPISHCLGGLATVLGRYNEADAYYAQAAAFSEHAGTKYFAAETDLAWATMLLERNAPGDAEKARNLLLKTQASAAAHGYGYVERRATEALQHAN